jgi:hypothetical protein
MVTLTSLIWAFDHELKKVCAALSMQMACNLAIDHITMAFKKVPDFLSQIYLAQTFYDSSM